MAALLETSREIDELLSRVRRIAVLGMKPASRASEPAFYVPAFARARGFEIVPVPVRYPDEREILGDRAYPTLRDVPGEIDLVNVFRRPADVPAHLPELLEKRPKAVWMQLGIRHDETAAALVAAGIDVVMDRCLLVELRRQPG